MPYNFFWKRACIEARDHGEPSPAVKSAGAAKRNKWRGPTKWGGARLCRIRVTLERAARRGGCARVSLTVPSESFFKLDEPKTGIKQDYCEDFAIKGARFRTEGVINAFRVVEMLLGEGILQA